MNKKWIALDIDGTITNDKYSVPDEVISYLKSLHNSGYNIIVLTGRSYSFACKTLSTFDFPYYFSLQNGSVMLEMPSEKILFKNYLHKEAIPLVEKAYQGVEGDFVVYSGIENQDYCYWRAGNFPEDQMEYIKELISREKGKWKQVDSFDEIDFDIPLIKCIGYKDTMVLLAEKVKKLTSFDFSIIKDPFFREFYLLMITNEKVNKGFAVKQLTNLIGKGEIIAAGNDANDISLLDVADIKIAMADAPLFLQKKADIIAPLAIDKGIIPALKQAIRISSRNIT
jgi:Cof subfamily protein (haloacid dehalogenase superfamily)